jgi:hypothetical protein
MSQVVNEIVRLGPPPREIERVETSASLLDEAAPEETLRWAFEWFQERNNVPYNPLHDRGYPSIGCTHCTQPVRKGDDDRAGRWSGRAKRECGMHAPARPIAFVSLAEMRPENT